MAAVFTKLWKVNFMGIFWGVIFQYFWKTYKAKMIECSSINWKELTDLSDLFFLKNCEYMYVTACS